ncbi:hypothetical protein QFC20_004824 [Naganishia adeliensis]|uniref:Uncharacterized protein n=1 Tax=Naganishia adeliensis TaxID=92952 RepID=A0ACC2VWM1_9TREE|nr:hypothetical protein QFC20_004824 [Naganishia adeliensis]
MLSMLRSPVRSLRLARRISHAIPPAPQKLDISSLDNVRGGAVFHISSSTPYTPSGSLKRA